MNLNWSYFLRHLNMPREDPIWWSPLGNVINSPTKASNRRIPNKQNFPGKLQTVILWVNGGLLSFGRILFYHCSNRNEEVFGQKKNARYLRQNISLDDEAEGTFGGWAILLALGQYFCVDGQYFLGRAILLVVCQTREPPLLTQASCSNCKSNNYGMGPRQKVK